MRRRTLEAPLAGQGTTLFTARQVMYSIRPADAATGIRFRRVDLPDRPEIPATIEHLSDEPLHPAFASMPPRCTTLAAGPARVGLVEHVLSALAGLGISDAIVEIAGDEMPIFDGSASPFVIQLNAVGVRDLDATIEPIVIHETIRVEAGDAWIEASPREHDDPPDACVYAYELDYGPNPAIQAQHAEWTRTDEPDTHRPQDAAYARSVAPARTFCLEHEARQMRALGLFAHMDPSRMLVLGPLGPIDNALRYENEPARHKLLDLIGDLTLSGAPIVGRVRAHKAGHALNHAMARRLASLMSR